MRLSGSYAVHKNIDSAAGPDLATAIIFGNIVQMLSYIKHERMA